MTQPQDLAAEFDVAAALEVRPRYNIAPTQEVPVIRLSDTDGKRHLNALRWGLIPHWSKDAAIGYRTINARSETVATQPAFRSAFRSRRCIVPANGFYEWQKVEGARPRTPLRGVQGGQDSRTSGSASGRGGGSKPAKQPVYIHRKDGRPLALAGLWDRWTGPDGKTIESFTIITTDANGVVSLYHDRMPAILEPGDYARWLDPRTPIAELQPLLRPCPNDLLVASKVSKAVNSPRNDGPECIEPVPSGTLFDV